MNANGSKLFDFSTVAPGKIVYYGDDSEPATPPRFLISELPEAIREPSMKWGELWPSGEDALEVVLAAGVHELEWRQPLRHIEDELVSDEVFAALSQVFGEDVSSDLSLGLFHQAGETRLYHRVCWSPGWPLMGGDPSRAATLGELVVREQCSPPLTHEHQAIREALASADGPVELAFPSWLDRDDRILHINKPVVAEGLRSRWEATQISQHLRSDNSEHDIWFTASAGGYDLHGRNITFRWVDAPVPDWVRE